jgi:hypothetical protein
MRLTDYSFKNKLADRIFVACKKKTVKEKKIEYSPLSGAKIKKE